LYLNGTIHMAGTVVKIKQSAVAGRLPTHGTGNATDIIQGELALNTADQKLYSKDSSNAIFEIGGGGAAGAVSIDTTEFVATSSQTSFAVTYSASNDHINVYFNGVWLAPTEFTATSGTAVVLDSGAPVGTEIVIQKIQALNLANGSDIDEHEFTATAGQTSFTISGGYTSASDVEVYVNGVKLRAGDFTSTSGTVVVLGSGAVVNDEVTIRIIKISVLTSTVSQTSETGAAILPAGTTAQRDGSPAAGYLRWNSTLSRTEVYSGSTWMDISQSGLETVDEDNMSSNSATKIPTQQSVKAYVDAQVTASSTGDITSVVAGTGLTGGASSGTATLNVIGGAGITANANDITIDSSVATLTGTQTLSAKTLTSPVINTGVSGTAIKDEDNMSSNSATHLATQQSIKAYVDAQTTDETAEGSTNLYFTNARARGAISAGNGISISGGAIAVTAVALTTVQTASSQSAQLALTTEEGDVVVRSDENKSYVRNSGSAGNMNDFTLLATPTDSVLSVNGQTGAITAAQIAAAVEAASNSNTFTDADHTIVNAAVQTSDTTTSGMGFVLDEDNMASNSATKLSTQQAIKAYVDAQIQTVPDAVAMSIALG
jgi:hypothetical protein